MPRVERYFPVAQDINGDSEVWVLTDTFGDRSLRIWLEILSITDRLENHWRLVDGWLASLSRKVRQSSATVSRVVGWLLAKEWLIVHEASADGSPLVVGTRNYVKFHRPRNTDRHRDGRYVGTVPSEPSEPILTIPPIAPHKKTAAQPDGFAEFWVLYPKKKSKGMAEKAWKQLRPDVELQKKIIAGIARGKSSHDWLKQSGQFIPYPATWLRAKGWEDQGVTFTVVKKPARSENNRQTESPTAEQIEKSKAFFSETITQLAGKMNIGR